MAEHIPLTIEQATWYAVNVGLRIGVRRLENAAVPMKGFNLIVPNPKARSKDPLLQVHDAVLGINPTESPVLVLRSVGVIDHYELDLLGDSRLVRFGKLGEIKFIQFKPTTGTIEIQDVRDPSIFTKIRVLTSNGQREYDLSSNEQWMLRRSNSA